MNRVDVAADQIDRATTKALVNHEVPMVTLVILVRNADGSVTIHQQDCKPASRAGVLAAHGVDFYRPTRSPRHAYAWMDDRGVLQVGGTSEQGKARLRELYHSIVQIREDLEVF